MLLYTCPKGTEDKPSEEKDFTSNPKNRLTNTARCDTMDNVKGARFYRNPGREGKRKHRPCGRKEKVV